MDRITGARIEITATGRRFVADTVITAEFMTALQEEIVGVIEASSQVPSSQDSGQLYKAAYRLSTFRARYGGDTGAVNMYAINPQPPVARYYDGLIVFFMPANANTADSSLRVNTFDARPLLKRTLAGFRDLIAAEVQAGIMAKAIYSSWLQGTYDSNFSAAFSSGAGTFVLE